MKPIIQRFLLLAVLLSAGLSAWADDTFEYEGLKYSVLSEDEKTVAVTACSYNYDVAEVTIPQNVLYNDETYKVTTIDNWAFSHYYSLSTVEFPETLTTIGDYAFYDCSSLTTVEFPSSLTTIGDRAFEWCTSLTAIELPSSLNSIGFSVFGRCELLTEISVDERNLCYTSVDGVLYDKQVSRLIEFPLAKKSVEIPSTVVEICQGAFEGSSLTTVEFPSSLTTIGDRAFYGCYYLTAIELPSSLNSIGFSVFGWCRLLTEISVDEGNLCYTSVDGVLYDKQVSRLIEFPLAKKSVEIPSTVVEICQGAFEGSYLTAVEFPSSLTTIGDRAFYDCYYLTTVEFPETLTTIGDYAFYGCNSLTAIELPASLKTICYQAFSATSITKVISHAVTPAECSDYAFDCSPLAVLYVPTGCAASYSAANGWNWFKYIREFEEGDEEFPDVSYIDAIGGSWQWWADENSDGSYSYIDGSDGCFGGGGYGWSATGPQWVCYGIGETDDWTGQLLTMDEWVRFKPEDETSGKVTMHYSDGTEAEGTFTFTPNTGSDEETLRRVRLGWIARMEMTVPLPHQITEGQESWYLDLPAKFDVVCPDSEHLILIAPGGGFEEHVLCDSNWSTTSTHWTFKSKAVEDDNEGVGDVAADGAGSPVEVYNLQGRKVADSLDGLGSGIYIVRQGRAVSKVAVR